MKKILGIIIGFVALLSLSACEKKAVAKEAPALVVEAKSAQVSSTPIKVEPEVKTDEFGNKLVWSVEFDDKNDTFSHFAPKWWTKDEIALQVFTDPKYFSDDVKLLYTKEFNSGRTLDQIPQWKKDTVSKIMWDFKHNVSNEDGIVKIVSTLSRTPNDKGGYDYFINEPTFNSAWDDKSNERNCFPSKPHFFKLGDTGKKAIEMRFKFPADPLHSFELYLFARDGRNSKENTYKDVFKNDKGTYFEELDLLELVTTPGQDTKEGEIALHGAPYLYENGKLSLHDWNGKLHDKYGQKYMRSVMEIGDVKAWSNEWHIFRVELTTVSMTFYLDGAQYKKLEWGDELGEVPTEQYFTYKIHHMFQGDWMPLKGANWENDNEAVAYIDYVREYVIE